MSSAVPSVGTWSPEDREQMKRHGLPMADVEAQLALFADPPPPARLERACTVDDGLTRLAPASWPALESLYDQAAARGRISVFVPASGAASRMFGSLIAARSSGSPGLELVPEVQALIERLDQFPFYPALVDELERRTSAGQGNKEDDQEDDQADDAEKDEEASALLSVLLDADGLSYATTAKALIPFHRDSRGSDPGAESKAHTALAEHVREAATHVTDRHGHCRLHFTIPQHQESDFRDAFCQVAGEFAKDPDTAQIHLDISTSIQSPETDTIAGARRGSAEPFRDDNGRLLLRPGGHGALLHNLSQSAPDIVLIRNIDNIQPAHRRDVVVRWNRLLGGFALRAERSIIELLEVLESSQGHTEGAVAQTLERAAAVLQRADLLDWATLPLAEQRQRLIDQLDRPLRVAGMVKNAGEPGGGPFWVRHPDGTLSRQIVETSQIDLEDESQAAIVARATHFNPVHIVARLRNHHGEPYKLERHVDPKAVFISDKSHQGRPLLALERPGLWNGAMAQWNTFFVEVPSDVFAPVKTVFDLLRPSHQPLP